jgi:hypothetical protein
MALLAVILLVSKSSLKTGASKGFLNTLFEGILCNKLGETERKGDLHKYFREDI